MLSPTTTTCWSESNSASLQQTQGASISTRRFSSILLPLGHGDPSWCVSCTRYEGYLAAVAWALVFLERWSDAMKTEVVRVSRLEYHLRNVIDALPE